MNEPIDTMLALTGTNLVFPSFTILGLPNYLAETLYNGTYKVEKQDFRFIISTKDVGINSINVDSTFYMEDLTNRYNFIVTLEPIQDLTGLSELVVDFVSKELL